MEEVRLTTKGILAALSELERDAGRAERAKLTPSSLDYFLEQLFAPPPRPFVRYFWFAGRWYRTEGNTDGTNSFLVKADDEAYYPCNAPDIAVT